MSSLTDKIEYYLKRLLMQSSSSNEIKIQRNKIAEEFNCVPSQINYVLKTRFNLESGYVVDSQRGGGGYVKITKLEFDSKEKIIEKVFKQLDNQISQQKANNLLQRLFEEEMITKREKEMLAHILHRRSLDLDLPERDFLRARLLKAALKALAKNN
ncbi:CtsR family transcriptional regulator [Fuchsiella alkaliacetigena]|uniref:CtsR family transcriptional regulator n=1 Tax=Fuchsiella alkaliacetigena TaxID=957042 RepID=UPI00200B3816|nr:CtsR family transcriptional regulator [Fuchsiella alkaliacetigena]MCK8825819.1 CtsR family transcriptional regulator [Fuchsiella alkaliacetigena]